MIAISPDTPQRHGCVLYHELIHEAQAESPTAEDDNELKSSGRQRIEVNVKINQSAGLIKKMVL
jgi:hypothetical protein